MVEQDAPMTCLFPHPPFLYHPSAEFDQLRGKCPVARVTTPDGNAAWVVTDTRTSARCR